MAWDMLPLGRDMNRRAVGGLAENSGTTLGVYCRFSGLWFALLDDVYPYS